MTIELDVEEYINLLQDRKDSVSWDCPDCLWEYFLDLIRECGVDPKNASPSYVVDNFLINEDWGEFDNYKQENETDEEFIERMEDKAIAIFPEERVIWL